MNANPLSLGLCFHRDQPAPAVIEQARAAEALGYDEFWVIEDCFFTAGISLATAALTGTSDIGVGLGIMPAVARNPAITAMEVATVAALAPGRFHAGIGHGVQFWMQQMGARVDSPLTMLEETIDAVRSLLAGAELTRTGRYVTFDHVRLEAPPDPVPLVSAGVRGPRSLEVSGRVADGTIMADFCSVEYLTWARGHIDAGAGRADGHRITVFASAAVSDDGNEARQAMSSYLAEVCQYAPISLRMAPFFDELEAQAEATGWLEAIQAMPAEWWRLIGPIGTPDDAVAYCAAMHEAGADCIAFFPSPFEPVDDATMLAQAVVARLR